MHTPKYAQHKKHKRPVMETFFVPRQHQVNHRLSSLSREIQEMLEKREINLNQSVAICKEQLTEISIYGQAVEKIQKKYLNILIFGIILTFISIFGVIFLPAFAIFIVVGILSAIVGGIYHTRYSKRDLPGFVREFLMPLLSVLEQESGAQTMVHIKAQLYGKLNDQQLVRKQLHSAKGYPKRDVYWYQRDYLHLQARLSNNTLLQLELSELIRRVNITKRNVRGKIKVKDKYKIRVTYRVKVGLSNKYYQLQTLAANSPNIRLKHKPGEKRQQIQVSLRHVHQQLDQSPQLAVAVQAIGEAYKQVKAI